jgi:hypothetical protein
MNRRYKTICCVVHNCENDYDVSSSSSSSSSSSISLIVLEFPGKD